MLRLRYITTILLLAILLYQAAPVKAQHFELDANKKQTWLRFRLVRDMVVIPLYINQKGPFNFVLDTGVGIMIITDPTLVDSINVNYKRNIKLYGAGSYNNLDAFATSELAVNVGQYLHSRFVSAAILKEDHFGLSNYAGIKIHGLLGYEFFANLAVKLNFNDSTLSVGRPGRFKPFRKGATVPISIEGKKPYFNTWLTLPNGCTVLNKFMIDLGAGHSLLLDNRQQYKYELPKRISANLGVGLTGPLNGYISRVDDFAIGKYRFKDVITSFPDTSFHNAFLIERDGNLGIGILKKFSIILDYSRGIMSLKPNYHFNEPFEHDMSGLEYYAGGNNLQHIFISRVEPGSAADDAGIGVDDEITAINFKSVQKMTLVEIDNIFKSRDSRNILVEICRDKKFETVVLTLKRRI